MKVKLKIELEIDDYWFSSKEERQLFIAASNDSKKIWLFEKFEPHVTMDNLSVEDEEEQS